MLVIANCLEGSLFCEHTVLMCVDMALTFSKSDFMVDSGNIVIGTVTLSGSDTSAWYNCGDKNLGAGPPCTSDTAMAKPAM